MSLVRLYFDADSMERAVISGLRARGIDATSAQDVGMADSSDEEQLDFARSVGRVLFSFNLSDFQRLHTRYLSQGKSHTGIVLAPQQRYSVGERIRRLQKLVATKSAEEMESRLEYLSDWI
jgi:predicted nuclease of predicted toxin-antitoxin system